MKPKLVPLNDGGTTELLNKVNVVLVVRKADPLT